MQSTIESNYQVKYSDKWGSLLQQEASRLEQYVTLDRDLSGKVVYFDQFGLLDFEEKHIRIGCTVLEEAPTYRRALYPRIFQKAIGFDEFDAKKLGDIDVPVSKTIEGLRFAAARRMDDVMIEGFLGENVIGDTGTQKVSLPAAQTVNADFVESGTKANSNLTVAKLRQALSILQKNEAWSPENRNYGDELVIAVTSSQIQSLLRETEVTSYDFNSVRALADGTINTFMGFKFVRIERMPLETTTNNRSCLAWVKSKAQFGIWDDFKVKLTVRDDLEESLQVRAKFACGATRLQEEAFVKILCHEG